MRKNFSIISSLPVPLRLAQDDFRCRIKDGCVELYTLFRPVGRPAHILNAFQMLGQVRKDKESILWESIMPAHTLSLLNRFFNIGFSAYPASLHSFLHFLLRRDFHQRRPYTAPLCDLRNRLLPGLRGVRRLCRLDSRRFTLPPVLHRHLPLRLLLDV